MRFSEVRHELRYDPKKSRIHAYFTRMVTVEICIPAHVAHVPIHRTWSACVRCRAQRKVMRLSCFYFAHRVQIIWTSE